MRNELTEIIFILDRSGSMSGLESDTIGGFNSFIKNQRMIVGDAVSTVVLFDDKYELLWEQKDIDCVHLSEKEYFVRGSTALLDAVGKTILNVDRRLKNTSVSRRASNIIFVITTDGYENASNEFSYKQINKLISDKRKNDWQFIFMGANINEVEEADRLGIDRKYAMSFACNEKGINEMYNILSDKVSECRTDKE